jgi:hypothetical protein
VPHLAEGFCSSVFNGAVIPSMGAETGRDLREYYSGLEFLDASLPLAESLRRLSEALDGLGSQPPQGFAAELVAVAPETLPPTRKDGGKLDAVIKSDKDQLRATPEYVYLGSEPTEK